MTGCSDVFRRRKPKSNNHHPSIYSPGSARRLAGILGNLFAFRFSGPGTRSRSWWRSSRYPKHGIPDPVIEPLLSTFSTSPDDFPSISTIASTSLYKTSHETNLLPDSDLHRTLQEWNARHREGMVSVILQKISTFLESRPVVAALEAIPNSPFMTGTIVRSVSALVIFGVNIPRRKRDACTFAIQVLDELRYMIELLSTGSSDDVLVIQCRRDLEPFCTQVEVIGEWARDQLKSTLAASANEEREDFRQKLHESSLLFLKLSTIRMIRSLSTIGQDVTKLLNFNERESQLKAITTAFKDRVATHYQYSAQGKQDCDPTTRNIVLAKINGWVRYAPADDQSVRCWWITGIAGIGKTAIAITMVECLLDRRPISAIAVTYKDESEKAEAPLLCAQYFFNHLLPDTANVNHLFPTLAFQLASTFPLAAYIIHEAIRSTPTIVQRFSLEQARSIFLEPLVALARVLEPKMLVVIIDGLDELQPMEGETLPHFFAEVTSILAHVINDLPWNVRLLILSRPQAEIIEGITPEIFRYHLDANDSQRDVRRYLTEHLTKVGHDTRHSNFPTLDQLDRLCDAANGHLGWAKQAVVWIKRRLQVSNGATINDDIKRLGKLAHGDLNGLYHHTLMSLLPPDEVSLTYYSNGLRRVLRILTVLQEPQTIGTICEIAKAEDDFNIRNCLMELSGLYAGTESITDNTIPQPHKSFYDFLTSQYTSLPFRVEIPAAHHELAEACFRVMRSDHLHFNMGGFDSPHLLNRYARARIPNHVRYACMTFVHHLQECEPSTRLALSNVVNTWAQEKFIFWVEVMSLLGYMRSHEHNEPQAIQMLQALSEQYTNVPLVKDCLAFIRATISCGLADCAPSLYIAALPFNNTVPNNQPCMEAQSKRLILPSSAVQGCPDVFTMSSEWVVLLLDHHIHFFCLKTGIRHVVDFVFISPPTAISLSADNRRLGCLIPVDLANGRQAEMLLFEVPSGQLETQFHLDSAHDSHLLHVRALCLSPHADQVAALFGNADDPISRLSLFQSTGGDVLWERAIQGVGISFLNKDCLIVTAESHIRILNTLSGQTESVIGHDIEGHVDCILVSPAKPIIAVVTVSSVMRMWNYQTGGLEGRLAQEGLRSACFSLDGDFLALGIRSVIQIWSCVVDPWRHIGTLHGHIEDVTAISFGANEGMLLSASCDGTVRLWDIRAILAETEFTVEFEQGALALGSWFKHCLPLGGWYRDNGEYFTFQYPFRPQGTGTGEATGALASKPLPWQSSLDRT